MRILIITKNFPPKIDGVGDYSFHLQRALQGKPEIDKVFIAASFQEEIKEVSNIYFFYKWNFGEFKALDQYIQKNRINSVLFQYVPYSFNRWGVPFLLPFKLKLLHVKLIIVFHEVRIKLIPWRKNYIIGLAQAAIAKSLYKIADKIITSTAFYSHLISRHDKAGKINIVPVGSNMGADVSSFQFEKNQESFTLGSFGQSIRSYPLILEAAKQLLPAIPALKVLFIGALTLEERNRIEAEADSLGIRHILTLTGRLPAAAVQQQLQASDIYLMLENPNYDTWNGSSFRSGSLAAAIQVGLPIIGNAGQLTSHEMEANPGITLLNPPSAEALARAILEFYKMPKSEKERLIGAVLQLYKDKLAWPKIADQFLKVIEE